MVKLPPGVLASQHTTTPTGSIIQTLVNPASMIQPMAPLPMLQQSIIQQPMGMSMSGFPPPMMNPSNEIQQDFGRGLASIFSNTGNPLQRTVGNNLMESQVISMGRSGAMSQVQGLSNPMQMMPNNPPPAFPPLPSSLINNNPMVLVDSHQVRPIWAWVWVDSYQVHQEFKVWGDSHKARLEWGDFHQVRQGCQEWEDFDQVRQIYQVCLAQVDFRI
jgi:hypothetical protein